MLSQQKKILIIGGNGFIGSHLSDLFIQMNLSVCILDKYPVKQKHFLKNIDYRIGDYADTQFLDLALDGCDTVINLACSTVPATSNDNCSFDLKSNLIPSVKLLDLMIKNKCKKIIFLSSGGAVYGNPLSIPTSEESCVRPISSYGIVKATIEQYIELYHKSKGLKSLIIRPSNLYGIRQGSSGVQGLINTLMDNILFKKESIVWGDGTSVRDYIYIKDLIDFVKIAIEQDAVGVFNIGSGTGYSVNEIIHLVSTITKNEIKVNYNAPRLFDVERIVLDIKKASLQLGWSPKTPIQEGILQMWEQKIEAYKTNQL